MNTISTELPPTSQSPKQALVALINDVAWRVDFLTGAAEDVRTALDAVEDVEIADADVMAEINDAVETVRSALDSGLAAVERAVKQLDALTDCVTDDDED